MTEEQVTKLLLNWLKGKGWEIVCYDFPQSGTGRFLHPDETSEKNKGAINPDIVAVKNKICVFFENKNRYYFPDFEKQHELITANRYTISINELLKGYEIKKIYYGIGLPTVKYKKAAISNREMVDFIIGVDDDQLIKFLYDPNSVFE